MLHNSVFYKKNSLLVHCCHLSLWFEVGFLQHCSLNFCPIHLDFQQYWLLAQVEPFQWNFHKSSKRLRLNLIQGWKKRGMKLKYIMLFLMMTWLMLLTWLKLTFLKVPDLRPKVLEDIEDVFLWLQLEGNCKEKFRQITFLSFYYLNRRYVFNHKKRL